MVWSFNETDNFNLSGLLELEKWFGVDLQASQSWLNKVRGMPDVLPGKKDTVKLAEDDLKISRGNLEKCKEAIKMEKKRAHKWETKSESKQEKKDK